MATGPEPPIRYGKLPGFGRPIRVEPGSCPICGAFPPCEVPKPVKPKDEK